MKRSLLKRPHGAQIIPAHVHFAGSEKGAFTSTPLKPAARVGENYTLLPQQEQARQDLLANTISTPGYDMQMAVQEFRKLHGAQGQ